MRRRTACTAGRDDADRGVSSPGGGNDFASTSPRGSGNRPSTGGGSCTGGILIDPDVV
jgi:hypothetical protein